VNIQEYISSGIVESYVLGLASAEESIEFEQLCNQYPELIEARKRFEESIEKQAMENSPTPPDSLKEKIWSAIQQQTKVVTMERSRSMAGWRWVAAASIIFLLVAGYFAFSFYNRNKILEDQLKTAQQNQDNLAKKLEVLLAQDKMMSDSNYMVVSMKSMKGDPSSASVFWDSTSTNVYMVVKNMPKLPSKKQYQLWALIDNATKPISLGQFEGGEMLMLKMDGVKKADAFAITIEEKGNAGGPNLKELQSMTKLQ
jgi:anti-sigma-K factor RskA